MSHRRTWNTPFTPLLRPGDSVNNVFALHHLMSNQVSYDGICAALQPGTRRHDKRRIERVCRQFVAVVFGEEELATQVLYENTLFGALSRGLSTNARETIARVMAAGHQEDDPGWLVRRFASRVKSTWTRSHRSCPKCVEEDIDAQGFPAWRVLHELAQVDRCVYHGCALQEDLPASGSLARNTYYDRLPNVGRCGRWYDPDENASPQSAGCSRYLQGWLRAFRGETPVLSADNWMQAVASATASTGSHSELHAVLEAHIVREWEGTLSDVGGWLRIKSGRDFLGRELALTTSPGCLAQRIVVLGALEGTGLFADSSQLQAEFLFGNHYPKGQTVNDDNSPAHAFSRALLDAGYPPAMIDALERGHPRAQIDRKVGNHASGLDRLLEVMSDEFLARLFDCRDWPEDAWITSAMRARQLGRRPRQRSRSRLRMFDHLLEASRRTTRR